MISPKPCLATALGPIVAQVQNRTLMPTAGFVFLQENLLFKTQKTILNQHLATCRGVFPVAIQPQNG